MIKYAKLKTKGVTTLIKTEDSFVVQHPMYDQETGELAGGFTFRTSIKLLEDEKTDLQARIADIDLLLSDLKKIP